VWARTHHIVGWRSSDVRVRAACAVVCVCVRAACAVGYLVLLAEAERADEEAVLLRLARLGHETPRLRPPPNKKKWI
jgi:hypothetical protein